MRLSLISGVRASLLFLLTAFALTGRERVRAEPGPEFRVRPVAEFPLDEKRPGILLPLTIGNDSHTALLDTGSLGHFLDETLAAKLGPALPAAEAQTPAGTRPFPRRELPATFHVAGLPAGGREAALFDTRHLSESAGCPVAGTLGLGLMRRHCWMFDFDAGKLMVTERLDAAPDGTAAAPETSLLHLPVEFPGGVEIPFMLDTGAQGWGTLEAELFDAMAARSLIRVLPEKLTLQTSAGAIRDAGQAVLRGLKFNGQALPDITLVRSDASRIGWKFFTLFNWQIDLSRSEISILPRTRRGKEVPADATALSTPTKNKTP